MSEITVVLIKQEFCYGAWPRLRGFLEPAIEQTGGRWRPEYVFEALMSGRQRLWAVVDGEEPIAAFTTEVCRYPEKRMLAVHYLGGSNIDEWFTQMVDALAEHAKAQDCAGIECNARFGFWKYFKRVGAERKSCFYELSFLQGADV